VYLSGRQEHDVDSLTLDAEECDYEEGVLLGWFPLWRVGRLTEVAHPNNLHNVSILDRS
jgi:hypothetical protein